MLTKSRSRLIRSLHEKKHRNELGLFLVEGGKCVKELMRSDFLIDHMLVTKEFHAANSNDLADVAHDVCGKHDLQSLGTLQSNDAAIAVVHQKANVSFEIGDDEMAIALDDIRDPSNLGSIIRIADWYGIKKIVASESTVDRYNSKAVSATKGSFTRVRMFYTDLEKFLMGARVPVLGTFLVGEDVHTFDFPTAGVLVMGNESNGISTEAARWIHTRLTIPSFGATESLNVAIASAVVLDNWRRTHHAGFPVNSARLAHM